MMMKRLKDIQKQFKAAHRRMQDEGKLAFDEAMQDVFEAHPNLVAVRWEQYTPYFNDGEECVFGVGEPRISFMSHAEDAGDDEDGFDTYSDWSDKYYRDQGKPGFPAGFKEAYASVKEVFAAVPREMMRAAFDDHVRVTVTRRGTDVEEYSHD